MRTPTILAALLLATAAFAFLPSADASAATCTAKDPACPGVVCVDQNADRVFQWEECVRVVDRCEFQSDCCSSVSFWCPETE
ncbi:MAG TPA: hypothetical protein VHH36_05485 [Candidatus Thermoplasmatota archaeon]|nr:hypothetical protein [Candidatus Thermoplasmatota archaeon]